MTRKVLPLLLLVVLCSVSVQASFYTTFDTIITDIGLTENPDMPLVQIADQTDPSYLDLADNTLVQGDLRERDQQTPAPTDTGYTYDIDIYETMVNWTITVEGTELTTLNLTLSASSVHPDIPDLNPTFGTFFSPSLNRVYLTISTFSGQTQMLETFVYNTANSNHTHTIGGNNIPPGELNIYDNNRLIKSNDGYTYFTYNETTVIGIPVFSIYGQILVDWENDLLVSYDIDLDDGTYNITEYYVEMTSVDTWQITQAMLSTFTTDTGNEPGFLIITAILSSTALVVLRKRQ